MSFLLLIGDITRGDRLHRGAWRIRRPDSRLPGENVGIGFERLVMYLTGISNIRDVLPFPRTTGSAEF